MGHDSSAASDPSTLARRGHLPLADSTKGRGTLRQTTKTVLPKWALAFPRASAAHRTLSTSLPLRWRPALTRSASAAWARLNSVIGGTRMAPMR